VLSVVEYLNEIPLAGIMSVVTLGFLLGRVRVAGLSLGPAGGTVVVALGLGHWGVGPRGASAVGLDVATVGLFGFCLFIYSVGFEAGPRFFTSLRGRNGWRFVLVGVVVNLVALAGVVAAARFFELDASTAAGTLAGALTSAPTYAAASEVAPDPSRLAVSFALSYPLGLIGLVLILQIVARRGLHPAPGPGRAAQTGRRTARGQMLQPEHGSPELNRVFRVDRPGVIGPTLRELHLTHRTGCVIGRIRRGEQFLLPEADTCLAKGDHLLVTGRLDELREFERHVGPEVHDATLTAEPYTRRVRVTRGRAAGETLADMDLIHEFRVIVRRIESAGILIEPDAQAVLHTGDVLELAGDRDDVHRAAKALGRFEPSSSSTDIAVYAAGIVLGLLLGHVHFAPIGFDFSLGLAGGLLISGVLWGRLRQIGPFSAHVPEAARQLVRDLGILLFVAERGLAAGRQLAGEQSYLLAESMMLAAATMVVALLVALFFARAILRMTPLDALGSVCGGLTSSSALVVIKRLSGGEEPAVSYAATYAVASVLVTMAGPFVVWLL